MVSVVVSVVSHGHGEIIQRLGCLEEFLSCQGVWVVVRDNLGEERLADYCESLGVHYIRNSSQLGFGENNNLNFNYACSCCEWNSASFFAVVNPDVFISRENVTELLIQLGRYNPSLSSVDLYTDDFYTVRDNHTRIFPSLLDFVGSFIFGSNRTVITRHGGFQSFDWCAGSFLIARFDKYITVGGFDEKYFMYCEDLDFCFRASGGASGVGVVLPGVKAVHLVGHENRNIFSRHFFWHLASVMRYVMVRNISLIPFYKIKSAVKSSVFKR